MGKLILIGVLTFLAVGATLDLMMLIMAAPTESEAPDGRTTADRFIAAQQDGETIPMPTLPRARRTPAKLENCTAAKLHPNPRAPMAGTVNRVVDGDTILVTVEGVEMRVRLWGIDAPERDQRKGDEATQHLKSLAPPGSRVVIHALTIDHYGRVVGNIGREAEWAVNFLMVAEGRAYHYRGEPSARNNTCLLEAEKTARQNRSGVWRNGPQGETRPWEHRRSRKRPDDL